MFTTILVPLDGSPLSRRALPYAVRLAKAAGGRVVLARSTHTAAGRGGTYPMKEVEEELAGTAKEIQAQGVRATSQTYSDDPADSILAATEEHHPDLILMATHGRGEIGRWFYGSVTDRVIRSTDVPVLVIPAGCHREWHAGPSATLRLLVALDGSEFSKQGVAAAIRLRGEFGIELVLLHVVEPINPLFGNGYSFTELDPEFRTLAAREMLDGVASYLRAQGYRAEARTATGQVPATIAEVALEMGIDVIVMATHGLGGMARLVMGSAAPVVLNLATVPVLLVRPDAVPGRVGELEARQPNVTVEGDRQPITVTLDPAEQDVLRLALGELLYSVGREEHLSGTIHGLLRRLPGAGVSPTEKTAVS